MRNKLQQIKQAVKKGNKFACLTAYDAAIARIISSQEVEVILVGDSLGMVIQGQTSTSLVTLADMVYHTKIVARANQDSLLMADIPVGCAYNISSAIASSLELLRAGAQIVKFEADAGMVSVLHEVARQGIPFCVHLGLRPQQAYKEGGYKIKGRNPEEAAELLSLAHQVEDAGADMLLLECVISDIASRLTAEAKVPVIGIGSGPGTDAQVLVIYDMLGLNPNPPSFVKDFLKSTGSIQGAVRLFRAEVLKGEFPGSEHSFDSK